MGGAADLERALEESRAREAALAEILAVISRTTTDLKPVFETILEKTLELARADTAAIQLREGDVFRAVARMGGTAQERQIDVESQKHGHDFIRPGTRATVTGRVAAEGRTVHVPDIALDAEYDPWARELPGVERALLGVPLFRGREVIGVVIARRRAPRAFSPQEIGLLEAFAHQASIAIENVRLFNEKQESLDRQTAISEVLKDMSRSVFDLERVLESVAMNAVRLCAADNGSIAQLGSDGWRLVANVGDMNQEAMERNWGNQPIEPNRRSLTGRVLMDRRTTTIVDAQADPEYDAGVGIFNVRSLIGVPLTHGEDIIGVLILRRQEPKPFTSDEIHLLETFADQASIAIENVRLFDDTKEALAQQTAISEVLEVIGRSTRNLEPVFEIAAKHALRLCEAENFALWEVRGQNLQLAYATNPPFRDTFRDRLWPLEADTILGQAIISKAVVHVPDVLELPQYRDPEHSAGLGQRAGGGRRMLAVPLLRGDEVVGAIGVGSKTAGTFTETQVRLVRTFADQVVIAIENVRLFNETRDALERETATSGILRVMAGSPTEVQPVLDAIAENAARVCGASDAHVYRVEGEVLKQWAHFGPIPGLAPGESLPLTRGSVIGRCIVDRRTIHTRDAAVDLDPAEYPISVQLQRRWGYRTALSVPLVRDGLGIGGIAIRRMEVQPFTPKQIELLETFADQAAIAIANVELFRTVERQRGELSRFLSPQVAALITSEQGAKMLEGHRRQITVAFCDLRNFTAFAETAEPEEVLGVLRDYHRAMGELIVEHSGTLEHFAGDGMMVFFNDPLSVERHELQSVRMACAMRDRFDEMASAWQKRGYELGFGVGIATGYATLGRIGFEGRYDYGAIGNVVILAQRLSAEAKAGQILLSQRVHAAVEAEAETTSVGDLTLKGFTRPVPAFAALSVKTPTPAR